MDNVFDFEGIEIGQDVLERTNPIFNTARMTLFQLAAAGHDDAKAIAERLNLTRKDTQDSKTVKADEVDLFSGYCKNTLTSLKLGMNCKVGYTFIFKVIF